MSRLLCVQGIYYFLTGLWPLLHMKSFLVITGGKTDLWLVRTVGSLIMVSGLALYLEGKESNPSWNFALLALGQAIALGLVDIYYSLKKVIAPIYLLDALLEGILISIWLRIMVSGALQ